MQRFETAKATRRPSRDEGKDDCCESKEEYLFSVESCVMGDTISLAYRNFSEIPLDILNHPFCPFIKTLDLTETPVQNLAPIASFKSLQALVLDKSPNCQLDTSPVMPKLTTLSCNNNEIEDLVGFMDILTAKFPQLQFLSMMRNPCNSTLLRSFIEPDTEVNRLFRLYVLYRMPGLVTIDCTSVTDEEVSEAQRRGQYAVLRKLSTTTAASASSSSSPTTSTDDSNRNDTAPHTVGNSIFSSVASAAQVMARAVPKFKLSDNKSGPYSREANSEGNRFIRNTEL